MQAESCFMKSSVSWQASKANDSIAARSNSRTWWMNRGFWRRSKLRLVEAFYASGLRIPQAKMLS
jgi:hypothetical protein